MNIYHDMETAIATIHAQQLEIARLEMQVEQLRRELRPQKHNPRRRPMRQEDVFLQQLREVGIPATGCQKPNRVDMFIVDFKMDDVDDFDAEGVDDWNVYAARIVAKFPHVVIVDGHNSVADWRPQKPIMIATVFLRMNAHD